MRELVVALASAGLVGCPFAAYMAASGGAGQPIYSGWKLLFLLGTFVFSAVGLAGALVSLADRGRGAALLGAASTGVMACVFLSLIRDQPAGIAVLSAAAVALPFEIAFALALAEYRKAVQAG